MGTVGGLEFACDPRSGNRKIWSTATAVVLDYFQVVRSHRSQIRPVQVIPGILQNGGFPVAALKCLQNIILCWHIHTFILYLAPLYVPWFDINQRPEVVQHYLIPDGSTR